MYGRCGIRSRVATHLLPPEWRLAQCLFGEHLFQDKVNANVALVESEKTAVICSLLLPEYIWLATGGKSPFNDRLMALKGRKATAFPDIDGYDEWRKKAKNYPMLDITISDILDAMPHQGNESAKWTSRTCFWRKCRSGNGVIWKCLCQKRG